jgi:hypothetical protein
MTSAGQKRAAIIGAVLVAGSFVAANVHLLVVAIGSQPDCVAHDAAVPAKRAC